MKRVILDGRKNLEKTLKYLKTKNKILLLTTSNRWEGEKLPPKSTSLAVLIKKKLGKKVVLIDVSKLKIYACEGNVSSSKGNNCGVEGAVLKDKKKNPSGYHRCWASINNKDDELWKISRAIFKSGCVVFFGSVRWGQINSIYQKLIERLTWIENRHSTLKGDNIVKDIDVGIIIVGQNWNGKNVLGIQKQVLRFFGFNVVNDLCWNWQYTDDENDESPESYKDAISTFKKTFF
ncbi:MAG TPA: hypothetical protein VJZ93_02020 [Candidatus Nanoarchaeia archaeon]|nr:hypothetical protein [Candidatus Nanoarchaeia archaeon]